MNETEIIEKLISNFGKKFLNVRIEHKNVKYEAKYVCKWELPIILWITFWVYYSLLTKNGGFY